LSTNAFLPSSEPAKLLQQYANFAGGYVTQNGGPGSRPERSDGVKYQPENERPNRRSEIGAAQGVLIIFLANRIGDWHEAVIIAALQIAVDEIAKSEGPK